MADYDLPQGSAAQAVDFFHESADDYARKHYHQAVRSFMTERQRCVLKFLDDLRLPRGAEILDAGCGPGHLVEAVASLGYRVSAMDAAEGMLRSAQTRLGAAAPEFPVQFQLGDIERLPYPNASFDVVLSTGVIEYLDGDAKVLQEFRRVLRLGGHLILPVTNIWSPTNWFDFVIEPLKRQSWIRTPLNAVWTRLGRTAILPRHFRVRRHRPARFRQALREAGFVLQDATYFHFLPWPRPLDQFFPRATAALGKRLEAHARSCLRLIGEGYLTCSQLPGEHRPKA